MANVIVTAPTPAFGGTRAGVTFRDGRGEVEAGNAVALAYFARHGYAVEPAKAPKKERPASVPPAVTDDTEGVPPDA